MVASKNPVHRKVEWAYTKTMFNVKTDGLSRKGRAVFVFASIFVFASWSCDGMVSCDAIGDLSGFQFFSVRWEDAGPSGLYICLSGYPRPVRPWLTKVV